FQICEHVAVGCTPKPFGRQAAVVPVYRQNTAETRGGIQYLLEDGGGGARGKLEPRGVEERGVHDVQRQFQQLRGAQWPVYLRRSCAIANGFVVTHSGIVRGAGLFEGDGRVLVEVQPVHPYAGLYRPGQLSNLLQLNASARTVGPCVDSVQPYFMPA